MQIKIRKIFNNKIKDWFNIIKTTNKSPDAIAYKNNNIYAVEILGVKDGYNPKYLVNGKESIYDMFDGVMIKTFCYDSDNVFTETYGRSSIGNDRVGGIIWNSL